jgi:hypothetical protein
MLFTVSTEKYIYGYFAKWCSVGFAGVVVAAGVQCMHAS